MLRSFLLASFIALKIYLPSMAFSQSDNSELLLPLCISEYSCGHVDINGKWIIEANFRSTSSFVNGVSLAQSGSGWGLIGKNGDWVLDPHPSRLPRPIYGEDYIILNNDTGSFITNYDGEVLLKFQYTNSDVVLALPSESLTIHQDRDTRELSLFQNYVRIYHKNELLSVSRSPLQGLIMVVRDANDTSIVINERFENLNFPSVDFISGNGSENIYVAQSDGKTGYIDNEGNWIIEPRFERGTSPSEGKAFVLDNDTWYLINMEGDVVRDLPYKRFGAFIDGFAIATDGRVGLDTGTSYVIDVNGNELLTTNGFLTNHGNGLFSTNNRVWDAENGWLTRGNFRTVRYEGEGYFRIWDELGSQKYYRFTDGVLSLSHFNIAPSVADFFSEYSDVIDINKIHREATLAGKEILLFVTEITNRQDPNSVNFLQVLSDDDAFRVWMQERYVGVLVFYEGDRNIEIYDIVIPEKDFVNVFEAPFIPFFSVIPNLGIDTIKLCNDANEIIPGVFTSERMRILLIATRDRCVEAP